jgi:hypothetical protein
VAVLPSVSATSDSIVIPLDRYLFPHPFLTLYYIIYTVLPSQDPLGTLSAYNGRLRKHILGIPLAVLNSSISMYKCI